MAERMVIPAPAKLNLFLHITGRREDGYHTLQTVFQLLDWGDTVTLERMPGSTIERVGAVEGVPEDADLALRAAARLQQAAREAGRPAAGARIALEKRIPLGSGLGGASTDAASVLLGLNTLWGCHFDLPTLARLGLELGADVPVFVEGASAFARGVGERLEPLSLGERWYVLVFPEAGVSTAELFQAPSLRRDAPHLSRAPQEGGAALGNDFFPVLKARCPDIAEMARFLEHYGTPRLSGTGSTLFLEAADEDAANRLTSALKIHYNVRAVRGRDRSPAHEALSATTN